MAAPKGNNYAVNNNGGRPPIYDESKESDIEKLKEKCESYFNTLKELQPPTITGLTLHLGFESKNTLYEYAKNQVFSDFIKRAITKIEQYHEETAAGGEKCTGNIFILKNMGWHDTVKQDVTTGGEKINTNPTIQVEIIKPIED